MAQLKDPLFKGATRPPMVFGVPVIPLVAVCGVYLLVSVWINVLLLLGLLPLVLVMRAITKVDDQQFRLLWLKLYFRVVNFNHNGRLWRASVYSPFAYFRRGPKERK